MGPPHISKPEKLPVASAGGHAEVPVGYQPHDYTTGPQVQRGDTTTSSSPHMSRTRKDDGREQGHADVGSRHSHSYTNGSPCVDCLRKDNLYELKQIELHDAEEQIAKESQAKIRREVKLWNREGEMAVTVNNLKAELRHVKLSHLETQRALEEAKIKTVHHDRNITQVRLEASERVLNFTNTIRRLEQELAIQSGLHTSVPQHGTNMSSAAGNIKYIDRDDSHSRAPRQS